MATWHQRRNPARLFDETRWTLVTDPPNELTTLFRADQKSECEQHLEGLRESFPHLARHSYILPPAREALS